MMDTRRDFLKKAVLLTGSAGLSYAMPDSIQRALNINPAPGSTYLDAEHVVILMQENRSFDHCFGALRGVRGFDDPRAVTLPDKKPVWLQTNKAGETYAPFRFDIRDTKITWMGSIPHSRSSQVDADNRGRYDGWLDAKKSGNKKYAVMPLTLGHYSREDLPFNYAMADAFTVCDQHFCSAMTSTWPNRLYLWSGTIRPEMSVDAKAYVRNDIPYGEAHWKTFPERLEEQGVSWKVYQNDISAGGGFTGEQRSWLSNFGCNPLEYLSQYNVRFYERYVQGLDKLAEELPGQIAALEKKRQAMDPSDTGYTKLQREIDKKKEVLRDTREARSKWSQENFERLSTHEQNLFKKAFSTNAGDPDYRTLTTLTYEDNGVQRTLPVPKGDVLYEFRRDVDAGKLPTVSWLVPSQNFSDHPSAPWYGTWLTSEILDILTKNPEVWKKTIFILTYDENDGYFDHVPPFVPPDPDQPHSGKTSTDMNTRAEFIRLEQELGQGIPRREARGGPIGLGFRVPMIIASPWSRGGKVCSEVLDHTSCLQFLEKFLHRKYGKEIREENITPWRRTVCGDLSSAFTTYQEGADNALPFLAKDTFIEQIYNARFKDEPSGFRKLSAEDIEAIVRDPAGSALMPRQEPGKRPACALPYELYADGGLSEDRKFFTISMQARRDVFGADAAGSPFRVYTTEPYWKEGSEEKEEKSYEAGRVWNYAVQAGDALDDRWPLEAFEGGRYHLRLHGPNGFFREFRGGADDPPLRIEATYERQRRKKDRLSGNLTLTLANTGEQPLDIRLRDHAYGHPPVSRSLKPGEKRSVVLDLSRSDRWYDLGVEVNGYAGYAARYAGKVETGEEGFSDPAIGRSTA